MLGDYIMVTVTPKALGRLAAPNAKQLIVHKLREDEKDFQFNSFSEREGEIVNGSVTSALPTGVTINLGRIEAQLRHLGMGINLPRLRIRSQRRPQPLVRPHDQQSCEVRRGPHLKGIKIGDPVSKVLEGYGTPSRRMTAIQGEWLVFMNQQIIFRVDRQGKVVNWAVFRIKRA